VRIAVVHNLGPGGAHRRLSEQVANLEAELVEVCLSTAAPITSDAIVVPYRALARRVPRAARPPLRYVDLSRLERAWRQVAPVLERVRSDVVYANPCRFLQAPAALLDTTLPSLYFCDEPRGTPAELAQTRNPTTSRLYRRLHARESRLDRVATSRATALATNSEFTAGAIRRTYGRDAAVLPMGIPPAFTPSWEATAHLLSVGTLIPDKGHDIVLRAASLARTRWPVMIVAPRPDQSEERRLLGLAAELGIELNVRVAISDAALVSAYRRAHATLYLSREEPFGLASLEAQACASPVIVSAAGGLPETLRHGETGWAVPRDASAVAAYLDLLENPDLRLGIACSAAAYASEATWARATAELERLLTTVCATSSAIRGAV
jgi:glycosyltransferase involved in cell wall biosynthesis